ncbi:uncharacterized protein [Solanum lycopersicum]|uniref:uncharacterized protein n=1 Tax=Solanum lycopersicum TaxID=4081 RepID=UPI00374925C4
MYRDLKQHFWWNRMKCDIVDFVAQCPNCQQVKYEHQRPRGTLQKMPIPEWKWERIATDFVVCLPKILGKFDSIWVIVDRLTKSAHFIPVKVTYNAEKLARLYISEIVQLHGVQLSILSDRDKVKFIQEKHLAAQNRQKDYVDRKIRDLDFMEGEQVLLKVSPMKGVMRFGKRGKLSPRYIGPFEVVKHVGEVANELALPPELSGVHPVFHVSMLKRYHGDGNYIIPWKSVLLDENLSYEEEPVAVLDREIRKSIAETEDQIEKRMAQQTKRKIQAVHQRVDAFEL